MCRELDYMVHVHCVIYAPPHSPQKENLLGKPSNPHCTDEDTKQLGKTQVPTDSK